MDISPKDDKYRALPYEDSVIESKNVTYATYKATCWQEDILVLICSELNPLMTRSHSVFEIQNEVRYVEIDMSLITTPNNFQCLFSQIEAMKDSIFTFWRSYKIRDWEFQKSGNIIKNAERLYHSSIVRIELSVWAIPYLLYYGKGIGGVIFRLKEFLQLSSIHSKKLFKLSCAMESDRFVLWEKNGTVEFNPTGLSTPYLFRNYRKASREIKDKLSIDISIEPIYETKKNHRGKKKMIGIAIQKSESSAQAGYDRKQYGQVFLAMSEALGRGNEKTAPAMEWICKSGNLRKFLTKCNWLIGLEEPKRKKQNMLLKYFRELSGTDLAKSSLETVKSLCIDNCIPGLTD